MGVTQNRYNSLRSAFPALPSQMDFSDFLIRLDMLGVLACSAEKGIEGALRAFWPELYPGLPLTAQMEDSCIGFFGYYRLGMKLLSNQERIQSAELLLKAAVTPAILLALADTGADTLDEAALTRGAAELLRDTGVREEDLSRWLRRIMADYFSEGMRLSPETLQLIRQRRETIQSFFNTVHGQLCSRPLAADASGRSPQRAQREQGPSVPKNFSRAMCLMFSALPKEEENAPSWEDALRQHWSGVFPNIPCNQRTLGEFGEYLRSNQNLDAFNMLFRHSLKEIRKERISRRIIVSLCVFQVLAKLPHSSPLDLVTEEAMNLFERFDVLSVGREEEDIEQYLEQLGLRNGHVEEQVTELIWEYAEDIDFQFRKAARELNSKDTLQRRYWAARINEKDRQVSELQNQVDATRVHTVYSIIEKLCSADYDHLLGRLYRFANGYDSPSQEQLRLLTRRFFQVLRLFDVLPTMEDSVGKPYSDALNPQEAFLFKTVSGIDEGCVAFPGWTVSGETVTLPIASGNKEGTDK